MNIHITGYTALKKCQILKGEGDRLKNKGRRGTRDSPIESPFKQIVDEGNYLLVVAELPGIKEEKIRINLENDTLTLMWLDQARIFQEKDFCLPCKVRLRNKKFQNGILEITLEKIIQ
jgi:HSP20 family protein